jgi:hypothetical protein
MRVGKSQRVVEAVGVAVVGLGVFDHDSSCLIFLILFYCQQI